MRDEIPNLLTKEPFQRFSIHLSNGQILDVEDPKHIVAIPQSSGNKFRFNPSNNVSWIVSANHVVAVRVHPPVVDPEKPKRKQATTTK